MRRLFVLLSLFVAMVDAAPGEQDIVLVYDSKCQVTRKELTGKWDLIKQTSHPDLVTAWTKVTDSSHYSPFAPGGSEEWAQELKNPSAGLLHLIRNALLEGGSLCPIGNRDSNRILRFFYPPELLTEGSGDPKRFDSLDVPVVDVQGFTRPWFSRPWGYRDRHISVVQWKQVIEGFNAVRTEGNESITSALHKILGCEFSSDGYYRETAAEGPPRRYRKKPHNITSSVKGKLQKHNLVTEEGLVPDSVLNILAEAFPDDVAKIIEAYKAEVTEKKER